MLTTLCIEHLAIVKQLELDFHLGMTAFTGETGAGKSVMIDALLLTMGERAEASVVRPGEDKCDITAGFTCDANSEPALWLAEHDIACESGEILLRRIIYAEGRSKSYINGQPFPLQKIKEFSQKLVHIHGQHQHQALMHHATHRQQLDQYANNKQLLEKVAKAYKDVQLVQQDIDNLSNQDKQADRITLLQFQLDELSAHNLQEGEVQALHQEHQMLHHAKEYLEYSQEAIALLQGDEQPSVCSGLNQILHSISLLPQTNPQINNAAELINSALIQCEEASNEIHAFADKVQLDPERLHDIEARMSSIHALARKYHVDSSQLHALTEKLQAELNHLLDAENHLERLQEQLKKLRKTYEERAFELRAARIKQASKLSKEITNSIQQLGMPKGYVNIEITPLDRMQAHGLDKVEYKVCTNPGMAPDSLNKIASGGELSRIGLAIQLITAQRGSTPTLLFDEVDVGIGGATAALVGRMLRQLGERLQVFCVTHQPQVASCAHNHFLVEKQSDSKQTSTKVSLLQNEDKINELARMLGGLTITAQTRSHAEELLLQSNKAIAKECLTDEL